MQGAQASLGAIREKAHARFCTHGLSRTCSEPGRQGPLFALTDRLQTGSRGRDGLVSGSRLLAHDARHVQAAVGVAPFVVVPGNEFDEGVVQRNAGARIEDGAVRVAPEVGWSGSWRKQRRWVSTV